MAAHESTVGSHRFVIGLNTVESTTVPISTRRASKAAIGISIGSSFTWSSAVVTVEWRVMDPGEPDEAVEKWFAFTPTITLITSRQSNDRISVSSVPMIRCRVTTAEGANDPAAVVLVHLS